MHVYDNNVGLEPEPIIFNLVTLEKKNNNNTFLYMVYDLIDVYTNIKV